MTICPLCDENSEAIINSNDDNYSLYRCPSCTEFEISDRAAELLQGKFSERKAKFARRAKVLSNKEKRLRIRADYRDGVYQPVEVEGYKLELRLQANNFQLCLEKSTQKTVNPLFPVIKITGNSVSI